MLNAVEPGTVVAIHRRVAKDECFVVLRGKVRVTTHDDDGAVIGDVEQRDLDKINAFGACVITIR